VCNHFELRVYVPSPVSIKNKNDLNDRSDHVSRANKLETNQTITTGTEMLEKANHEEGSLNMVRE